MLVEFSVENFRSLRSEARISLVADSGKEHRETHVSEPEMNAGVRPIPLVRSAAVYGANASGKTNLVRALQTMRRAVLHSVNDDSALSVVPFRFDPESEAQPTTFEVIGIVDGTRFQYGFSANRDIVTHEWLYAWPRGRIQIWFERTAEAGTKVTEWKFGGKLAGDKDVWRRATRPNSLFLSTAVTLNSERLKPFFHWFQNNLHIARIGGWADQLSAEWCASDRKAEVIRFLRAADLAIDDLRVIHEDFGPEMLPGDMPPEIGTLLRDQFPEGKIMQVRVSHDTARDRRVELELDEESDGTRKMFDLAAPWLDTLENGHVIVFDELHDNLHPFLVRFLVDRFHDQETNPKGAQLLFTTHDTSILNQDVFRRDQIWFCERDSRLETRVFPLSDFRPRRGVENLERAYLAGRYGALPYVRSTGEWTD